MTNEIIQSVHVSFLSGVSKVSPDFTLERSTTLALMSSFSVENKCTLCSFRNYLNLRLTIFLPLSPCILFGILFEVVNMYATASTNYFADLSFICTTHAYL